MQLKYKKKLEILYFGTKNGAKSQKKNDKKTDAKIITLFFYKGASLKYTWQIFIHTLALFMNPLS